MVIDVVVDRVLHPDVERLGTSTVNTVVPSVIKFIILGSKSD